MQPQKAPLWRSTVTEVILFIDSDDLLYRSLHTKMNESTNNISSNIFLPKLYDHDWSMALAIMASLVNIVLVTPLAYSIIWFERFGSDMRRTFMNQTVAAICWNIVFHNTVNVPLEIALTVFGPFGGIFCSVHMILKYSSMFHLISLLLVLILTKYISVFILKNPTSIESNYWTFVINLTVAFLCTLSQFVFTILPGRNPVNIYICMGKNPSHLEHLNVKQNYPFTFVILACLISYTLTVMKIKLYEKKISTNATQSQAHQGSINQGTLASLGSIGFHFVLSIFASLSYYILNTRDNTIKLFGYNWLRIFINWLVKMILVELITAIKFLVTKLLFFIKKPLWRRLIPVRNKNW